MTLFEELKFRTKPAHDELEKNLDLLSDDLTIDDYVDVLKKFYGVYVPVEQMVSASPFKEFFHNRFKVKHIENDLKHFGISDAEIGVLPLNGNFKKNLNHSELLGTLYVLEGSTLGALILAKHFGLRFNLDRLKGLSYFSAYGENTLPRWREWREISERLEKEMQLHRETIVGHADKTFSELQKWMC